MLVLSRKVGERVWIGDKIAVTIVRVAQGVVRLGIEAPEEMPIVREELRQQLQEGNGAPGEAPLSAPKPVER